MRSLWLLLSGTAKIVSDLPSTRTRTNSDLGHFPNKPKPWYHTTGTPIPLDHNTILLVLLKRFQLLKAIKPSVFFLFSCLLSLRGNTLMSSKCISNPKAPRFEKENSCQWTTQPWRWIILIRSRCIACVARYILNFRLVVVSITTFKLHCDSLYQRQPHRPTPDSENKGVQEADGTMHSLFYFANSCFWTVRLSNAPPSPPATGPSPSNKLHKPSYKLHN